MYKNSLKTVVFGDCRRSRHYFHVGRLLVGAVWILGQDHLYLAWDEWSLVLSEVRLCSVRSLSIQDGAPWMMHFHWWHQGQVLAWPLVPSHPCCFLSIFWGPCLPLVWSIVHSELTAGLPLALFSEHLVRTLLHLLTFSHDFFFVVFLDALLTSNSGLLKLERWLVSQEHVLKTWLQFSAYTQPFNHL